MSSEYDIRVADAFGNELASLDEFIWLDYARSTREVGVLQLGLDLTRASRSLFVLDGRISVWRKPDGGPRYLDTETVWLVRKVQRKLESGKRTLVVTAYSANHLLTRRVVAYDAGSSEADKTDYADDLMKAIVRENLGALATDTDRDWSAYLSVQADLSLGPSLTKAFSRRNVLTVLQELHDQSVQNGTPVYFDIVSPIPGTLEFRTYINQRGMDRSLLTGTDPIILSPERGNLGDVSLTEDWSEEATFVYAGGQGEGTDRMIETAQDDTRIGASPFGRIEIFCDARHYSTTASVAAEAEAALRAARPGLVFSGDIQDTPQCRYGVHWRWGDRLTGELEGTRLDCNVDTVRVRVENGDEEIKAALWAAEALS